MLLFIREINLEIKNKMIEIKENKIKFKNFEHFNLGNKKDGPMISQILSYDEFQKEIKEIYFIYPFILLKQNLIEIAGSDMINWKYGTLFLELN